MSADAIFHNCQFSMEVFETDCLSIVHTKCPESFDMKKEQPPML